MENFLQLSESNSLSSKQFVPPKLNRRKRESADKIQAET